MSRRITHRLVLGLSILGACVSCRREPASAPPAGVRVQRLRAEPIQIVTQFKGVLRPRRAADLSFGTGGTVEHLLQIQNSDGTWRDVQENDVICAASAKTPLASLDKTGDQQDYDSANRRLAWARRASALAQRRMLSARLNDWFRPALLARDDQLILDQLQLGLQAESAGADARRAKHRLDADDLWIPFDPATIVQKYVAPAQQVAAGQLAFRVMDLSQMHVDGCIPDGAPSSTGNLPRAQVFTDAHPNQPIHARLASARGPVVIDHPQGLLAGQAVSVALRHEETGVLIDPAALQQGDSAPTDLAVLQVFDDHGQTIVRRQPIDVEPISDSRLRLKTSAGTIKAGDAIVAASDTLLHDNQPVRVVSDDDPPAPAHATRVGRLVWIDLLAAILATAILLLGRRLIRSGSDGPLHRTAAWSSAHRWPVAVICVAMLAGGIALLPRVGVCMLPLASHDPPVQVRFAGPQVWPLRQLADRAATIIDGIRGTASIRDDWGPDRISIPPHGQPQVMPANLPRRDGQTCLTISCQTLPGLLPSHVVATLDRLLGDSLPQGYRMEFGGEPARRAAMIGAITPKIPAIALLIYLALMLAFGGLRPATIGVAAALLASLAAALGLLVFDDPFTLQAGIGVASVAVFILLCVRMLIHRIDSLRRIGAERNHAIAQAAAELSFRALVLTWAAAVALAAILFHADPTWRPMLETQIVGLLVTPILLLLLVPALGAILLDRKPVRADLAPRGRISLDAGAAPRHAESIDAPQPIEPATLPAAISLRICEPDPQVARLMAARRAAG